MTAENEPHEYDPSDTTGPMHSDPRCAVCGERKRYYLHK